MTKNGNRSLRTLVIHGARSVMRCVKKRDDSLGHWLKRLETRRGFLKTTVALANKLTRIIWRILTDNVDFNINKAFAVNELNAALKKTCLSEFAGTDDKTATGPGPVQLLSQSLPAHYYRPRSCFSSSTVLTRITSTLFSKPRIASKVSWLG